MKDPRYYWRYVNTNKGINERHPIDPDSQFGKMLEEHAAKGFTIEAAVPPPTTPRSEIPGTSSPTSED